MPETAGTLRWRGGKDEEGERAPHRCHPCTRTHWLRVTRVAARLWRAWRRVAAVWAMVLPGRSDGGDATTQNFIGINGLFCEPRVKI